MIKTIASLFAIYGMSHAQVPPGQAVPPAIPPMIPPQAQATIPPQAAATVPPQAAAPVNTEPPISIPPVSIPPAIPPQTTTAPVQLPPVQIPPVVPPVAITTSPPVQIPPVAVPQATVPPQPVATVPPNNGQWVPITSAPPQQPISTATVTAPPNAVPIAPAGKFFGPVGQLCPIPPPDGICQPLLPSYGGIAIEQYPGFTKCERVGDCCGCSAIQCGNEWTGCNTFSAGDHGATGNQNIRVFGRPEQQGGGMINCIGENGCAHSVIDSYNIKSIDADKAGSMKYANVKVTNPIQDFNLDCIGLGSCEGMDIEIIIPGPPPGFMCNPAYVGQTIEFNSISCYGQDSCKNMNLVIDNQGCNVIDVQQIECYAPTACNGANFEFKGRSAVTVGNCNIIGSTAGIGAGLAQICGIPQTGQAVWGQPQWGAPAMPQQPANPAWLPQI